MLTLKARSRRALWVKRPSLSRTRSVSVRRQDLLEVALTGMTQQFGAARMAGPDERIDERVLFRGAAVLRVQCDLVRAVGRLAEGIEQLVLELVDLVEDLPDFLQGRFEVRRRVERPSQQARDELADLVVRHGLERGDGVELGQVAEERIETETGLGERDELANLLVRIRSDELERRDRPLPEARRRCRASGRRP